MNEQLQKKLIEWMNGLEHAGAKALEFASGEMPELFKEIVAFGVWYNGVLLFIGATLIVGAVASLFFGLKYKDKPDVAAPIWGFSLIQGAVSIIIFAETIKNFILAATAPRLYIIEYISTLIK